MPDDFEAPLHDLQKRIEELAAFPGDPAREQEAGLLRRQLDDKRREVYAGLSPWQKTQVARHPNRPYTLDYVKALFTGFTEVHGDRRFGEDPALVAGFAFYKDRPVAVLGHQKGRDTKQKIYRNFGMPKPEGYRKALRVMRMAAKFSRPIITFVDTPGAYPGLDAEERGQAEAIAFNLREMARLRDAHHRQRDRRGGQRRGSGHRRRRPREHARALDLLRHLARGLRLHPVARRRAGGGGGHGDEDHGRRPQGVRDRGRRSCRSPPGAPTSTTRRRSRAWTR